MIKIGSRLQNNETKAIVTVVKTQDRYTHNGEGFGDPPAALKWVFYLTPTRGNLSGHRLCRIAADRIFPLPQDGQARKKGYTLLEGCEIA